MPAARVRRWPRFSARPAAAVPSRRLAHHTHQTINYLAHLYLANDGLPPPPQPAFFIGNLMGDFVKGRLEACDHLSDELRAGIRLHRQIDSFTDAHPVFRASRRRLQPPLRRYGGIVIDLFYDYFLALNWASYSDTPLRQFTHSVYVTLQTHYHILPPPMRRSVRHMTDTDLLWSYRQPAGIVAALAGIERRLKRPADLRQAGADLRAHHAAFSDDFKTFFADLSDYARRQRNALTGPLPAA